MPIEQAILEMEGQISLLDNPKFIGWLGALAAYSVVWLGFLTHMILQG